MLMERILIYSSVNIDIDIDVESACKCRKHINVDGPVVPLNVDQKSSISVHIWRVFVGNNPDAFRWKKRQIVKWLHAAMVVMTTTLKTFTHACCAHTTHCPSTAACARPRMRTAVHLFTDVAEKDLCR